MGSHAESAHLPSGVHLVKMAVADLQGIRGGRRQKSVSLTRGNPDHVDDQDDGLRGILV